MKKIFKIIYLLIPFKKYIFIIIRFLFHPNRRIYKHLHFKGKIKIKVNQKQHFKMMHFGYQIENELFWDGIENAWESVSLKYWIQLCKDSKIIVDVGANTGLFSLIAKTVNSESKVYAFEPIERNYTKLKQNCELNNYNIHCLQSALSNKSGEAHIFENPSNDIIYSVTVNKSLIEITENVVKTPINIIRMDEFIEQNNIENIDLIKIDVETHEPEVLEGFGKYLTLFQPTLLIEVLDEKKACEIENIIKEIPYLYFMINEETGIRRVNHLSKSESFNFLICRNDIAVKLGLVK